MITDMHILQKTDSKPVQKKRLHTFNQSLVCNMLSKIQYGCLEILDEGTISQFGDPDSLLRCRISVHHPDFWSKLAYLGSTGSGISYQYGHWDCDNLTSLVRIVCRNSALLSGIDGKLVQMFSPVKKLLHFLSRNTIRDAKKHIKAHYDIGNDLFKKMLDKEMMYSAAIYQDRDTTLEEASEEKLKRICDRLELKDTDHVIEIGTGWGGFALYAALNYGCRVTTTTISDEQYACAKERIDASPVRDRITLLNKDYRSLSGSYDKLVSIEMIEAVGYEYFDNFFKVCSKLLKHNGLAVIQAITLTDQEFDRARREVDFIKEFIFPGCCIPSVTALNKAATNASDLHLHAMDDYSAHYARTLADWRERFNLSSSELEAMGYNHQFQRLWNYYLCYCEGGFAERYLQSKHFTFVKPGYRNDDFAALGYGE